MKTQVKLEVPYFSQLDNATEYHGSGSRQCNLTSRAMFLGYLKPRLMESVLTNYGELETFYGEVLAKYGDTTSHEANTKALSELGIESKFSYTLSINDLLDCLSKGYPMVLGVAYKSSGHMVVAVGYDLDRQIVFVHDPYGVRHGASNSYHVGANGSYDTYSFDLLKQVWVDMGDEAGWGRVPTSVNGKATGLSLGL